MKLRQSSKFSLIALSFTLATNAQAPAGSPRQEDTAGRAFAIVDQSSTQTSQWGGADGEPINRYVKDHPGTYVVFLQNGALYRLDNPDRLAEVHKLYEPMQALAAKQQGLAKAQQGLAREQQNLARPQQSLAQQQQSLASQQMSADPKEQARLGQGQGTLGQAQGDLGRAQGEVGRQQGDLGSMQGALGRQQAELARSANKRMQAIFDECLADGSCHRVAS